MNKPHVISDPNEKLEDVVNLVCDSNEPVTVSTASGKEVRVIPVPKPIRMWKGKPVYRGEDAKYLYLDHPWLLE
jgi:hypothetical protein